MPSRGLNLMWLVLAEEALQLAQVLVHLLPKEPNILGLLTLMHLHHAWRAARMGPDGMLVSLEVQDQTQWEPNDIALGLTHLQEVLVLAHPGPYQMQVAIAVLHAKVTHPQDTNWPQCHTHNHHFSGFYALLGCSSLPHSSSGQSYQVEGEDLPMATYSKRACSIQSQPARGTMT